MTDVCAFCLGGDTEIPPFGSAADAEDLILPCATCSLVAHRMCLMDWFNLLPKAQLTPGFTAGEASGGANGSSGGSGAAEDTELGNNTGDTDETGNIVVGDNGVIGDTATAINSRWGTLLIQWDNDDDTAYVPEAVVAGGSATPAIFVAAKCPQCKSHIVFQMNHSWISSVAAVVRASVRDMVTYSGVFLGISGAATGVVTLGYVGLARCGLNMLDAMVPQSLLVPLLSRRQQSRFEALRLLAALPSSPSNPPPSDRIDRALSVMDHLKFQLLPLLPVMLYRSRQTSWLDCVFSGSVPASLAALAGEFLVGNYVSALTNHRFFRRILSNTYSAVTACFRNKSTASLSKAAISAGIDFWDPAVMIGAVVPARWLYHLIYRISFNRAHFDLAVAARPRAIANTVSESDMALLELLENRSVNLQLELRDVSRKSAKLQWGKLHVLRFLLSDDYVIRFVSTRARLWWLKTKACLSHDYSGLFLSPLSVLTAVLTFLWPFLAADVGRLLLHRPLSRLGCFSEIPSDKLLLLSNLAGMFVVAFANDAFNLFMSSRRARRLVDVAVVTARRTR